MENASKKTSSMRPAVSQCISRVVRSKTRSLELLSVRIVLPGFDAPQGGLQVEDLGSGELIPAGAMRRTESPLIARAQRKQAAQAPTAAYGRAYCRDSESNSAGKTVSMSLYFYWNPQRLDVAVCNSIAKQNDSQAE